MVVEGKWVGTTTGLKRGPVFPLLRSLGPIFILIDILICFYYDKRLFFYSDILVSRIAILMPIGIKH